MFHVCKQCSALFVPTNKRGRASQFCGKPCQNRYHYLRQVQNHGVPCTSCGKPMLTTPTSAPDGQRRCFPCRRVARGLAPDELYKHAVTAGRFKKPRGDCYRCKMPVPVNSRRWKFCSAECLRKERNARGSGSRGSTQSRGYDKHHVALRKKLLPLAYGTDCHLCGEVMNKGDRLHLDHTEDRSGYRGFVHDFCNVLDGARRGGQRARQKRLERGWRPGQDPSARRRPSRSAA